MAHHRSRLAAARAAAAGLVLLVLSTPAAPAAARTLHWSLLDVDARIEADGAIRTVETHHVVYDGDWNGGERVFNLRAGQEIEDFRLARIHPETGDRLELARGDAETGERRELARGDLDQVDHYDWTDSRTVRWRSRLPSDPPFENRTLVYELSYRLTGALLPRGEGVYRLSHDFAFPDRVGVIERFVLDLEVDPAFYALGPLPEHLERETLHPGASVVLEADLRYLGEGRPAATVPPGAGLEVKLFLILVTGAVMVGMLRRFYRGELAAGRRPDRPSPPAEVDRVWVERELLPLAPEVVGALWDRRVRSAEVSALIARLVGEGKLASSVEPGKGGREEMRLRMVAPVESFTGGYEADLVSKLFVRGKREVTTSELRKHYEKKGFDPTGVIRGKLEKRVERDVPSAGVKRPRPSARPALALFLAAVAFAVAEGVTRPAALPALVLPLMTTIPVLYAIALAVAASTRWKVDRLRAITIGVGAPLVVMALGIFTFALLPLRDPLGPGLFGVLALLLAALAAWRSATHMARTRETPETLAARRKLYFARRYFERELAKERPDLDDAWFPYVLAFGLSRALDRWSQAFGGEAARTGALAGAGASSWSGGAGGSSGGGWTGGGGQFGGAGASGAWAVAATGLAAGVSPPSSSGSGGGGGGGGGGSSGGGGGGGW